MDAWEMRRRAELNRLRARNLDEAAATLVVMQRSLDDILQPVVGRSRAAWTGAAADGFLDFLGEQTERVAASRGRLRSSAASIEGSADVLRREAAELESAASLLDLQVDASGIQ